MDIRQYTKSTDTDKENKPVLGIATDNVSSHVTGVSKTFDTFIVYFSVYYTIELPLYLLEL